MTLMPVCPPVRDRPLMVTLSASSTVNTDALVEEAATSTHGPVRTPITQLWLPLRVNGQVIAGRALPRVILSPGFTVENRAVEADQVVFTGRGVRQFDRGSQACSRAGVAAAQAPPDASPLLSTT